MSKELFTSERERAMIDKARSQEQEFTNRQINLKHDKPAPRQQPTARL